MDAPAVLYALRWLIHDTFRQTIMSRVFWIMLVLSGLCILFCLGVSIQGGATHDVEGRELFGPDGKPLTGQATGRLSLFFGAFPLTFSHKAEDWVHFLQNVFASWVAGVVGLALAFVFTAGFVPESLAPSAASVLLAKPTPRWLFLLGKFLGVVCFVAVQVAIFFLGTWIALGLRTGYWPAAYLLGIPITILHFAVIFSFSILMAVLFRSATACVVGTMLFWLVCALINYGRHAAVVFPDLHEGHALPPFTVFLSDAGYWLLPKPIDFTVMMQEALGLGADQATWASTPPMQNVLAKELFHPLLAALTSCLFPIFALWAAASQLAKTDY